MKRAATILAALSVAFAAFAAPVRTATETFVTNKIAEAIENLPSGGITTNDVRNIVTNETATFSAWTLSANGTDFATGVLFDYSDEENGFETTEVNFGDNQVCFFDESIVYAPIDATTFTTYGNIGGAGQDLEDMWYGTITATRKRIDKNALGLAREQDMPQKSPVDEILLNGADGKIYHLRIGAGGSVDIYTEVTP